MEELSRAGLRNPVRVAVRQSSFPASLPSAAHGNAPAPGGSKRKAPPGPADGDDEEEDDGGEGAAPLAAGPSRTPQNLSASYLVVPTSAKLASLLSFLAGHRQGKVIVYFLTCACVDFYAAAVAHLAGGPPSSFSSSSSDGGGGGGLKDGEGEGEGMDGKEKGKGGKGKGGRRAPPPLGRLRLPPVLALHGECVVWENSKPPLF